MKNVENNLVKYLEQSYPNVLQQGFEAAFQKACDDFVKREVIYCQSALVNDLIKLSSDYRCELGEEFDSYKIENYETYPKNQYYIDELEEDLEGNGRCKIKEAQDDSLVATIKIKYIENFMDEGDYVYILEVFNYDGNLVLSKEDKDTGYVFDVEKLKEYLEEAKVLYSYDDLHEDKDDCEREPQEIFEWWIVTGWLAFQLKVHGEPILDNAYGTYWGRTTTGQSISMDYVIRKIVSDLHKN